MITDRTTRTITITRRRGSESILACWQLADAQHSLAIRLLFASHYLHSFVTALHHPPPLQIQPTRQQQRHVNADRMASFGPGATPSPPASPHPGVAYSLTGGESGGAAGGGAQGWRGASAPGGASAATTGAAIHVRRAPSGGGQYDDEGRRKDSAGGGGGGGKADQIVQVSSSAPSPSTSPTSLGSASASTSPPSLLPS